MGCEAYSLSWPTGQETMFSEMDDTVGCLCTFPHNDGLRLDADRVQSLALLGAAVVLHRRGLLTDPYCYIPSDIPQWISDGINACLKH